MRKKMANHVMYSKKSQICLLNIFFFSLVEHIFLIEQPVYLHVYGVHR